jgi:hypothetical protein
MTYVSGGLIQATDYNGFVSTTGNANINAIWGQAGSATIGYGQGNVSTVSVGSTVTATQWATLNSTLTSIGAHQNTTLTSRSTPTAGATITILSNLGSDIGNCYTNRLNSYATGTQYTAWTGTSSKTTATGSGNAAWSITFTHTVSFANSTATNNFFNAGGLIKIQFSKSSTGTDSDADWNNLANNVCGTVWLSSDAASKTIANVAYTGTTVTGGSGTPSTLLTGTGFYQLTGSPVVIYKQFDNAYTYTSNFIQVSASYAANAITLTTVWNDAGDVTPFGSTNDISGGTATSGITFGTAPATVVTYLPPETSFLTNTWGTPTVAASVV